MAQAPSSEVSAEFEPAPETVRDVRRFVMRTVDSWGADTAYEASLLTSELATNAVIHARTRYTVRVSRRGDRIRVEVSDGSTASARRCHFSALSGTGRGLGMVADTAEAWGVETLPAGKVIWFEICTAAESIVEQSAGGVLQGAETGSIDLDAVLASLGREPGADDADDVRALLLAGVR